MFDTHQRLYSYTQLFSVFRLANADAGSCPTYALTFNETNVNASITNPERGFFIPYIINSSGTVSAVNNFTQVTSNNFTLAFLSFVLEPWASSTNAISATWFSNTLVPILQLVRKSGLKAVLRFSYNNPSIEEYNSYLSSSIRTSNQPNGLSATQLSDPIVTPISDNSVQGVQIHASQLGQTLSSFQDIILSVQAGFVGVWGEWHDSTHGIDSNGNSKQAVVQALQSSFSFASLQMRLPSDILEIFGTTPMTNTTPSSGIMGFHNDCFLSSANDTGTWGAGQYSVSQEQSVLGVNGNVTIVGGETCAADPTYSPCLNAQSQLAQYKFTYLNGVYSPDVISLWQQGGCFYHIRDSLGYQLAIANLKVRFGVELAASGNTSFDFEISIGNKGYGALHRPRPSFLVLHSNSSTDTGTPFQVTGLDLTQVPPRGQTTFEASVQFPSTIPPGKYAASLWFPDQSSTIQSDSRYALRLVNPLAYNQHQGFNLIAFEFYISPNGRFDTSTGCGLVPSPNGGSYTISWAIQVQPIWWTIFASVFIVLTME